MKAFLLSALKKTAVFFILILLFLSSKAYSATTYYSRATGNWNEIGTWSTVGFASALNDGTFPVAGDTVNIGGGVTVTVNVDSACTSLIYSATTTANSSISISSGIILTVSGSITLPMASSNINTVAVGDGILNVGGNIDFTNGGVTNGHQITISTGTVRVVGNVTQTGSTGSASVIFSNAGFLKLGGTFLTSATGTLTPSVGTVEYFGNGAQTVGSFTYNNLTLSGSGAKTTTGVKVNGLLSMEGTATASVVPTYGSTATLQYNAAISRTVGVEWQTPFVAAGGIIVRNTGVITLNANKIFSNCPLTVLDGATLNLGAFALGSPSALTLECGVTGSSILGKGKLTLGGNVTVNYIGTGTAGASIAVPIVLGTNMIFAVETSGEANTDLILNGVVSGVFDITKSGVGRMAFAGANTYSGVTNVSAGALVVSNAKSLGTTVSGTIVSSGAVLEITNNVTIMDALTIAGTGVSNTGVVRNINGNNIWRGLITQTASSTIGSDAGLLTLDVVSGNCIVGDTFGITFTGAGDFTVADPIAIASGTVTKFGLGTLKLSGINTYTGATMVNGGTLKAGVANSAFGSNSAMILANTSGVVLDITGFNNAIGSLTGGGTITLGAAALTIGVDNSSPVAYAGVINGTGGIIKEGTGVLTLSGVNTYTGSTKINGGTLKAGVDVSAFGSASAVTLANVSGAILDTTGFDNSIGSLTGGGTIGGNIIVDAATLTIGNDNSSSLYTGVISGTGAIVKSGSGILTLSGVNTYTGTTTVNEGVLKAGVAGSVFGSASAVTLANTSGVVLNLNGFNNTIGSLTGGGTIGGNVTLGAATLTIGSDNSSPAAYAGTIIGAGAILKSGTGTLILSGTNTYFGATTVSEGTLRLGASTSVLGTVGGKTTVNSGAVLDLNGFVLSTAEPLTLNGTGLAASPAGALTNTGADASYSGAITLGSDSTITATSSGTLTCSGTVGTGAFGLIVDGSAGTGTMSGIISKPTSITKNGAGTWVLSGANTYKGLTSVNAGTLKLGSTTALGAITNDFAISSGAKADVSSNVMVGSLTLGGLSAVNGTWGFTGSGATNMNSTYFVTSTSGVISVNKDTRSTPTVTPIIGFYTYNGVANGPNTATNTGTGTSYTYSYSGTEETIYGPSATAPINAGSYIVTVTVAESTDGFYKSSSSSPMAFTISKATLTITANDASKCQGTTYVLGTTAFTSNGLVSGEVIDNVTLLSSGAISSASAGSYAITPSVATGGTFLASNYAITYTDGFLIVNPLPTATIASTDGAGCIGNTVDFTITGTVDAVITYNINGDSDTTATLTEGTAVISIPGATETQVFTLVSVSNGICTASIGDSATVNIGVSTTYIGKDDNGDDVWTNGSPTSAMKVVFENNYTISTDFAACAITVNSGDVSVISGKNVSLNGAITVTGGSFTLNNNANLYQADASAVNTGNIIVKRDTNPLMRLDYTMWGSPVSGQKLLDFSPLTTITPSVRFYTYDTTSNSLSSVVSPETTDFATGTGYLIRLPYNHPTSPTIWNGAFTGVPNNGTQTVVLNNVAEGQRFNAVGNPYPSPISISQFALDNASNIQPTLYFWRKTNGSAGSSYCTWNTESNTFTGNDDYATSPNGVIRTGQGFIVEAKDASTLLEFNNGQRIVDNANQFFKTSNAVTSANPKEAHRIWLNLKGAASASQIVVGYFTNATLGADATDSKILNDASPIAMTMKIEGNDYVIQGRPIPFDSRDIVPLSYKVTTAGSYNFTIDHVDGLFADGTQDIFIKDKLDGSYHAIGTATPYVFTSEVGTFADRFELVYTNKILSADQNEFNSNSIVVYHQQNDVIINTGAATMETVKVFDISGRLLIAKKNINLSETRINLGTTNQVVLVEVTTTDGLKATKKVIN